VRLNEILNEDEEKIREKALDWLVTNHDYDVQLGERNGVTMNVVKDKFVMNFDNYDKQLVVRRKIELDFGKTEVIEFPDFIKIDPTHGIVKLTGGIINEWTWVNELFLNKGNLLTSKAMIKSFDGLSKAPIAQLSMVGSMIPKTNWRELKKLDVKGTVSNLEMVSNTKMGIPAWKIGKLAKGFYETETLLDFQSWLIDHDLESWF
jgi:hypothetical protein